MATCEHVSMLETTFPWTIDKPNEFWTTEGQIKKAEAFTLNFGLNTRVCLSLVSEQRCDEIRSVFVHPHVEYKWKDNLIIYLWSEKDENPGDPIVPGQNKQFYAHLRLPFQVYCKVVLKKCHLCGISPSFKEQTEQLTKELVVKDLKIAKLSKERDNLTAKLTELQVQKRDNQNSDTAKEDANSTNYFDGLWKMRAESKLTDFCLEVEGNSIQVHKLILATRSGFFVEQFEADPTKTTYKIEGANPEVVNALVEFMYLGRAEKFDDYVTALFELASKFGIPTLKNKCVEFFKTTLSMETAPDLLILGVENEDDQLSQLVINFAEQNGSKEKLFFKDSTRNLINTNVDLFITIYQVLSR